MLHYQTPAAVQCSPATLHPLNFRTCLPVRALCRSGSCAAASDICPAAAAPVSPAAKDWQQQQQQQFQHHQQAQDQHQEALLDHAPAWLHSTRLEKADHGQQHQARFHHPSHASFASSSNSSDSTAAEASDDEHVDALLDGGLRAAAEAAAAGEQQLQLPMQSGDLQQQQQMHLQQRIKQRKRRQLTPEQSQQRWQRRQHQKQLKQHQQQLLQQRQQQLSQVGTWQQLLLLAADITTLQARASWLCAMIIRAAQLHQQHVGWTAGIPVGREAGNFGGSSQMPSPQVAAVSGIDQISNSVEGPDTAAAAAAANFQHYIGEAADLCVDHDRHEHRQQQQLIYNLLHILGNNMQAAVRRHNRSSQIQRTAAAAAAAIHASDPSPLQLCQVLTQLSLSRLMLPAPVQQQLAAYVSSKCSCWQSEEAAAVLISLARLQPSGLRGSNADEQLQQQLLIQAVSVSGIARSGVRTPVPAYQAAAVLWAAARLKWRPSQQWVAAAAAAVVQQVGTCSSRQLAMALWGMAGLRCDVLLLRQALQQQQDESVLHNHHRQQQQLLPRPVAQAPEQLLQAVYNHVDSFNAKELGCVLWAAAQIPLLPQMQLTKELLQRCQQQQILQQYSDIDIACILWSLARVVQQQQQDLDNQPQQQQQQQRYNEFVDVESVHLLFNALMVQLPASHIRATASALQSAAALGARPPSHMLFRVLQHLQNNMSNMSPGDLASVISAVAEFRFLPPPEWLGKFYRVTYTLLRQSSSDSDQYTVAPAAASSGSSSSNNDTAQSSSFTSAQLAAVAAAVYRISRFRRSHFRGQKPPAAWLDALAAASMTVMTDNYNSHDSHLNSVASVTPKVLSLWGTVFKRFSRLAGEPWPGPGKAWMDCYITVSQPLLTHAAPWDLCNILEFVVSLQKRYGPLNEDYLQAAVAATRKWAAATLSAQQQQQQQPVVATAADLIMMGRSLARLGVLPDLQWQQQWVSAVELTGAQLTSKLHATFIWSKRKFTAAAAGQQQRRFERRQVKAAAAAADPIRATSTGSHISSESTSDDSYDSLQKAYEDVSEPHDLTELDLHSDDDVSDDQAPILDPAAAAADSSSILEGLKLAQQLHQEWEQQQRSRSNDFAVMWGSYDASDGRDGVLQADYYQHDDHDDDPRYQVHHPADGRLIERDPIIQQGL